MWQTTCRDTTIGFYTCESESPSNTASATGCYTKMGAKAANQRAVHNKDCSGNMWLRHSQCVHQNGLYFNHENNLAWDEKYKKIKNWDRLHLGDYKIANLWLQTGELWNIWSPIFICIWYVTCWCYDDNETRIWYVYIHTRLMSVCCNRKT